MCYGDYNHTIRRLVRFIELMSKLNEKRIIHMMMEPTITKGRENRLNGV
jgi:hypothetical protein